MIRLSINNISKSFKGDNKSLDVIKNISLDVSENEIVGIIGPSGCGKTTLFNIISGINSYDRGKISIDSKDLSLRQGICGYMFQEPLLFPWMSAIGNIMLSYEIKRIPKAEAEKKAKGLLDKFHLLQFKDYYPHMLSGGMRQKIALLRTVAFNSKLLLLDEPFGSIDAITRIDLHYYLYKLWKKLKLTILFTTHDIREAVFLADRIYVLSKIPTTVLGVFNVNLGKPRKIEQMTSKQAVCIEKKLLRILKQ
jgi:ABC-type nitrate/sulfonate/bicarbonate transport system ATPase subunit